MKQSFLYARVLIVMAMLLGFGACEDKEDPKPSSFRVTGEVYSNLGSPVQGIRILFNTGNSEGIGYGKLGYTEEDGSFDVSVNDYDGSNQFSIKITDDVGDEDLGEFYDKEISFSFDYSRINNGEVVKDLGRIELTKRADN
jgi:putative lipoprotein (rSAM/lipoprotein system)